MIITESVPVIEGFHTSPPQFSQEEKATIKEAQRALEVLSNRSKAANTQNIIAASRSICDAYADGSASLTEMLCLAPIAKDVSDAPARALAARASEAIFRAENKVLRDLSPFVIHALTHRAEEIRLACNRIETREHEDSDIAGIDHEPSELLLRSQATFRHVQARVRALRDGNLPSRAEVRDLAH
jgi:hypothetical protein